MLNCIAFGEHNISSMKKQRVFHVLVQHNKSGIYNEHGSTVYLRGFITAIQILQNKRPYRHRTKTRITSTRTKIYEMAKWNFTSVVKNAHIFEESTCVFVWLFTIISFGKHFNSVKLKQYQQVIPYVLLLSSWHLVSFSVYKCTGSNLLCREKNSSFE